MKACKNLRLVALLFGFVTISIAAQARTAAPATATIVNSGYDKNKDSYSIVIDRSGNATYTREPGNKTEMTDASTTKSRLSMELTNRFFSHLDAAMPISNLPSEPCGKDDSLGSDTYINIDGQRSPNLGCAHDQRKMALYDDITVITSTFAVKEAAPVLPPADVPPMRAITLADDTKTIHLKVGDVFALRLGTTYTWALAGMDQSILDQDTNAKGPEGTQGVFKAASKGITDLRAIGDPHCKTPTTPCGSTRNYKVTIIVDEK
jgi:hypothetical protein